MWLIWQRKLLANTVHIYVFLAFSKYHVSIKLMSTTGKPRNLTLRSTLQKKHINLARHLIWVTLDINWSSVILKLGNAEIVLPNLVTVHLVDKNIVRSIRENTTLLSSIILFMGVTWQAPHKPNALPIQDFNQHTLILLQQNEKSTPNLISMFNILNIFQNVLCQCYQHH